MSSKPKKLKKKDLKPNERSTKKHKIAQNFGWLFKLPILRQIFLKYQWPDGFDDEAGQILPVNLRMGDYEDAIVPKKLMDYFIDKAGTIMLMECPCRVTNGCKNHSIELGCIWMGNGATKMDMGNLPGGAKGYFATKEQAKERVRLAIEDGLLPSLGKFRSDAIAYNVLEYKDELMNFCFCCSCCCVLAEVKYAIKSSDYKQFVTPLKGVSIKTDPDKCVGCGACFKVCIYGGLKMVNGKSVHTDGCVLCGRCETVCPEKAISISFDETLNPDDVMKEIIDRYDNVVDISG